MNISILETARQAILEERNALTDLAKTLDKDFENAVDAIFHCKGRVIISGIGKSALIAQKIAATFNSVGTPSFYLHAAEAVHGDLGMIQGEDIVIILSKSGESEEIKTLVSLIKSFGNLIISITSYENSYLAKQSNYVINAHVEKEACANNLAPTTSATVQTVIGDALAICLMQLKNFSAEDFAKLHPGGNLGKRLYLKASDIYRHNAVPHVTENTDLKNIIFEISKGRMGAVAVLTDGNKLCGIITDGDIRRLLEKEFNLSDIHAKNILTPDPKTIRPETTALEALNILKEFDLNQLIVTDLQQNLLGFIHIHDLLREGIF